MTKEVTTLVKAPAKNSKYKIAQEPAQAQVDILLENYDFDVDEMPVKQAEVAKACIQRIVKAVRMGRLEITETDTGIKVVQHLKKAIDGGVTIEYAELGGKAKTEMGNVGDNEYRKIYALLGSLSNLGEAGIKMLKGADLSVAESLGYIFLQV